MASSVSVLPAAASIRRTARSNERRHPSAQVLHRPRRPSLVSLQAKKGFDLGKELLDVMEGGPKLRKWCVTCQRLPDARGRQPNRPAIPLGRSHMCIIRPRVWAACDCPCEAVTHVLQVLVSSCQLPRGGLSTAQFGCVTAYMPPAAHAMCRYGAGERMDFDDGEEGFPTEPVR